MPQTALVFLAGVLSLRIFSELSWVNWSPLWLASFVLLVISFRMVQGRARPWILSSSLFVVALTWSGLQAQNYLQKRLPESMAGQDIVVTGVISNVPQHYGHVSKFEFDVMEFDGRTISHLTPEKLRLSWYYSPQLNADEQWQLVVRLKPPHGFMNPGGFDYEGWLLQQNIHATGYVRKNTQNRKLGHSTGINHWRQRIDDAIAKNLESSAYVGIVQALATGNRQAISQSQWQTLLKTGTNHLMAISGLHIGLAALFAFVLVRHSIPAVVLSRIPAQVIATVAAFLMASVYAMLAGLAIPTQRALIMLGCFALAFILRRHVRPVDALSLALLLVLLISPQSVHSAGFWFSFLAVAIIMLSYRLGLAKLKRWQQMLVLQLILAIGLFPISLFMFQAASAVSPLANLVMVPYVSFTVVPLVLLSIVLLPVLPTLSSALMQLADGCLAFIWPLLQRLSDTGLSQFTLVQAERYILWIILLIVAVLALYFRGRLKWRYAAVPVFGLVAFTIQTPTELEHADFLVDVLDVGQGTSVVIRTRNHTLVYDTGARLGDKLDAGASVVVPFLRVSGVRKLDKLIISHGDADHIGGAKSVLQAYPDAGLIGQEIERIESLATEQSQACWRGQSWNWDGVDFRFLHPGEQAQTTRQNNISCVLKVSNAAGSILLTGDIEKKAEKQLLRSGEKRQLDADILLVPHHGSSTSSSRELIDAVSPEVAVITAGYRNRYRHPVAAVVARYDKAGVRVLQSGLIGTISFVVDAESGVSRPILYRQQQHRYWHHRLSDDG